MENARVALVHDWFPVRRGGEKVLEVFAEIFPEAPIYALFHFPGSQVEEIEKRKIRTSFIQRLPFLEKIKHGEISPNYKALLQEFVQNEKTSPPVYQLREAIGPDHDKQCTREVLIEDNVLGRGTGKNKQAAEIEAARSAWEKLRCSHG